MNNDTAANEAQNTKGPQPAQPAQEGGPQTGDNRQQAIEQEQDTARLRSERKSVEDGNSQQPD